MRLKPAAEKAIRSGHPWVFAGSIREQSGEGTRADLAVIYDRHDKFLAAGLYDPDSPLRVRVVHLGKPRAIDAEFWRDRLLRAFSKRTNMFDERTTGYRVLNGESEGMPGMVIDRYGYALVLKIYTACWLPRLAEIVELLSAHSHEQAIVLRLSRNIQAIAGREYGLADGHALRGEAVSSQVVFLEDGLRFQADVLKGQKTGFFLDQRENRRQVGNLAKGARVLNCFSFSGGFSLHAARGGAVSVADLDISQHALDSAAANFSLNEGDTRIAGCEHRCIRANAFDWLQSESRDLFDVIVLDPPSLAKKRADRENALKAYRQLTAAGISRVDGNGILVSASCSAHIGCEEFFGLVTKTAAESGRRFAEIGRSQHAPDHPAIFPEAEYLKCIYLRME